MKTKSPIKRKATIPDGAKVDVLNRQLSESRTEADELRAMLRAQSKSIRTLDDKVHLLRHDLEDATFWRLPELWAMWGAGLALGLAIRQAVLLIAGR